jgi:hypothetical protein
VAAKLAQVPEMRVLLQMAEQESPHTKLSERFVQNMIDFVSNHLSTKGTRHADDQTIHDALLTALVDERMLEDRLINTIARQLDVR